MFYGAMIAESVIALVWAAAGVAFYGATGGLQNALSELDSRAWYTTYPCLCSVSWAERSL